MILGNDLHPLSLPMGQMLGVGKVRAMPEEPGTGG